MKRLPVVVAGGGIAGLAAAIAVARAGREAIVCERAADFEEAGAGLQLGPNAVRALKSIGAWEAVEAHCFAPEAIVIRDGVRGRQLKRVALGAAFERRFGEPYRVAHRADLLTGLLAVARSLPGIVLRTGAAVEGFRETGEDLAVTLSDGEALAAGGLIGADGLRSRVRDGLFGPEPPVFRGHAIARSLVAPKESPNGAAVSLWLCPGGHVVRYPVRGGSAVNLVAAYDSAWVSPHWSEPGDEREIAAAFAGCGDDLREILAAAPRWRKWAAADRPARRGWSRGRVTLAGDAAHPALPYLAQGAAMAIEDAACLGRLLSPELGLAQVFAVYERERFGRAARHRTHAARLGRVYHLRGIAAAARNRALSVVPAARFIAGLAWLYGHGR